MRLVDADALSKLVGEPIEVFMRRLDLKLPHANVRSVEILCGSMMDNEHGTIAHAAEQRWTR